VWRGEAWRLLTGPLLHANFTHIWMNGAALLGVGPLVEVHARRGALPLVFLVSALGGSLLSLVMLPDATSVGASGGIMGLIGFLGVLGVRRRDHLPAGFVQGIGLSIAATAVLGIVGIQMIDNAATWAPACRRPAGPLFRGAGPAPGSVDPARGTGRAGHYLRGRGAGDLPDDRRGVVTTPPRGRPQLGPTRRSPSGSAGCRPPPAIAAGLAARPWTAHDLLDLLDSR
jgi:hypothetical protein